MIQIRQSLEKSKISTSEKDITANDAQLIAEARIDPEAFARLYRRHYEQVFRYCVHRLFNRQTAEDITSVVFLKTVENFGRFKGTEQQFRNWIFKIATNAINSHIRKTVRRNGLLLDRFRVNSDSTKCEDDNELKLAILEK
ncbi:MAG: RNA polymerase sigma factor, partial [Planctomycetota bacterium]